MDSPAPPDLAAELALCREQLLAERTGRIRAERALRDVRNDVTVREGYPLLTIGRIASPLRGRWGAPRQGLLAPDVRAHLELSPAIPADALRGLAAYSHVFVVFLFHENSSMHKLGPSEGGGAQARATRRGAVPALTRSQRRAATAAAAATGSMASASPPRDAAIGVAGDGEDTGDDDDTRADGGGAASAAPPADESVELTLRRQLRERHFHALIEAPALRGERTGVFSTRSPHRPNVVGLSLCRLVGIVDRAPGATKANSPMLLLSGCDLIHGTPVVDIKPFAPYDCPVCIGSWLRRGGVEGGACSGGCSHGSTPSSLPPPPPFIPARDLASALTQLKGGADLWGPPDPFALRGPPWVFDSLRNQAAARLPVVWAEGTLEAIALAVRTGHVRFYGLAAAALLPPTHTPCAHADDDAAATKREAEAELLEGEVAALVRAFSQVLALDIRAVHHGRGGAPSVTRGGAALRRRMGREEGGEATPLGALADVTLPSEPGVQYYELWLDVFNIRFTVREEGVEGGGRVMFARVEWVAPMSTDTDSEQ